MSLRVVRIAAGSSLRDSGRKGWRHFGVPPGGAFDRESLLLANALFGNEPGAPALEIPLLGGVFEAESDQWVSVVGARCEVSIDGSRQSGDSALFLRRAQSLGIEKLQAGVRVYLGAPGGWSAPESLGSRSGFAVTTGQSLASREQSVPCIGQSGFCRLAAQPESVMPGNLRVLPGPHSTQDSLASLCGGKLTVSPNSSRMGVRLEGFPEPADEEIPSEPSCPGALQVTPDGTLIALGPDGPTIGGYPKIAYVVDADLDRLGQLAAGQEVRFEMMSLEEAKLLRGQRALRLARLRAEIAAVQRAGTKR